MEFRLWIVAALLFLSTLPLGCASLASRGLLPEVQARRHPQVSQGPEVVLLNKPSEFATSLITVDGRAHVFATDNKRQLNHIELLGDKVVKSEILGVMKKDVNVAIDAVEQLAGELRVLAGDKQYVRANSGQDWQEIKGNRCERFLPSGDNLFCAFVIKGEEVGAPERTDYTAGLIMLIPWLSWSNKHAAKLVVAQESKAGATGNNSWTIRAVVDPDIAEDADHDFMVDIDNLGTLHLLYFASRGGGAFFFLCGGSTCAGGFQGPAAEFRYAKVALDRLVERPTERPDSESTPAPAPVSWLSLHSTTLPATPYKWDFSGPRAKESLHMATRPLDRRFVINKVSGQISGLNWGRFEMSAAGDNRQFVMSGDPFACCLWVEVEMRDGSWLPRVDVVAGTDLPDSTYNWLRDAGAVLTADNKGNLYALLEHSQSGFWKGNFFVGYLVKSGNSWSAPLTLGTKYGYSDVRTLTVSKSGSVFAAWVNEEDNLVGQWIRPLGAGS